MASDPIIDEVHAIRDALAREYNYDVKQIVDALQRQALPGGARVVSFPAKRIRDAPGGRTG